MSWPLPLGSFPNADSCKCDTLLLILESFGNLKEDCLEGRVPLSTGVTEGDAVGVVCLLSDLEEPLFEDIELALVNLGLILSTGVVSLESLTAAVELSLSLSCTTPRIFPILENVDCRGLPWGCGSELLLVFPIFYRNKLNSSKYKGTIHTLQQANIIDTDDCKPSWNPVLMICL